jgi:uncharacterized membrane-anchored protein YitT (DUF2179 family)/quinol monooxygenase YgiN
MHVIAWRFVVKPQHVDEFRKQYGPDGAWEELFRRDDGYVKTELIPDPKVPTEFVTLDHWITKAAFDRFISRYKTEYETLDRQLAHLTARQERIDSPRSLHRIAQRELVNTVLIVVGVLSAGMGIKGFLLSSHFIDGGITGTSMLLAQITPWPLSLWLPLMNLPFIAIGIRHIGVPFALRSSLAIAGLAFVVGTVRYPDVTPDLLLTAVFGGFFLGAGIGMAVRGGAVLDGTEIVALLISRRNTVLKVGDVILAFNVVLFLVAMAVLGVEVALYSILTYFAAAKTLDFVIHGIEEYTAMTIVSSESGAIREAITGVLGRGVTVYRGYGGLTNAEQDILYCVVTRLEIGKIKTIVRGIDENAFIVSHALADVDGGVVKKSALHMENK